LCGARLLAALLLMALVRTPMQSAMAVVWVIVAANVALGAIAGVAASAAVKELKRAGVME